MRGRDVTWLALLVVGGLAAGLALAPSSPPTPAPEATPAAGDDVAGPRRSDAGAPSVAPDGRDAVAPGPPSAEPARGDVPVGETPRGTRSIAGTVESDGGPVGGARVVAVARGPDGRPLEAKPATATCGADGSFRLEQLGEGVWVLHAEHPTHGHSPPARADAGADGVVLRLPPPGWIEGRVTDAAGATIARSFTLSWRRRGGTPDEPTTTAEVTDGAFRSAPVAAGVWVLEGAGDEYVAQGAVEAPVSEGRGSPEVAVRLVPSPRLEVVVTTEDGRPASGAAVTVTLDGPPGSGGRTGAAPATVSGEAPATFVGLAAGRWVVRADARRLAPAAATVHLATGATERLTLRLAPVASVRVVVLDERGRPVPDARFLVDRDGVDLPTSMDAATPRAPSNDPEARRGARYPVGADGSATFDTSPGPVRVTARAGTVRPAVGTAEAVLEAGRTTEVRVTVESRSGPR